MTAESDDAAQAAPVGGSTVAEHTAEPRFGSRAPALIQRSRPLHLVWQVGVFVVGLAVVAGGVILLPLPGPGWLVIFGGVAIWGTEFTWAQRVLLWVRRKAGAAARATKRRFKGEEREGRPGGEGHRAEGPGVAGHRAEGPGVEGHRAEE
jgi:uncharacterized protein (TIGR02611 family)